MLGLITIQQNFPVLSKNTWVDIQTNLPAEIELGRGRNWYSANRLNSEVQGWVKTQYIEAIGPGRELRIIFDGRVWNIISIIGIETRFKIEILVKGGVPFV